MVNATINKMPRWIKFCGKVVVSAVLLFFVFSKAQNSNDAIWSALDSIAILDILFGGLLFVLLVFVKALRWRYIIRICGGNLSVTDAFLSYLSGIALGAVTPGRVGEFARAYVVKAKSGLETHESFISVIADRLFDLFVLCVLGGSSLAVYALGLNISMVPLLMTGLIFIGIAIIKLAVVFQHKTISVQKRSNMTGFIKIILSSLGFLDIKNYMLWVYTLIAYFIYFTTSYYVIGLAGVSIGFMHTVLVVSCAGLVVLLPISIAGLGTRELIFVIMLGAYGVCESTALVASLLHFSLFFVLGSLLGFFAFLATPIKLHKIYNKKTQKQVEPYSS